jgi:hypothetical protein
VGLQVKTYRFHAKDTYRWRVWNEIDKMVTRPRHLRTVVYLDTSEALETEYLLGAGYCPENMLAVNRSPAQVARLTLRLKTLGLPTVKTAGVEWERAITSTFVQGQGRGVDVVNFDGTGCLSPDLVNLLAETVSTAKPKVMAVNMLAGREWGGKYGLGSYAKTFAPQNVDSVTTSYGRKVNPNHAGRLAVLLTSVLNRHKQSPSQCDVHVVKTRWDVYTSESGQPMVWCVAGMMAHDEAVRRSARSSGAIRAMPPCVAALGDGGFDLVAETAADVDVIRSMVREVALKNGLSMREAKASFREWAQSSPGAADMLKVL